MSGPADYGQLGLAFQRHSDTSRAAAESMVDRRPSALDRVYACILFRGYAGATDEEVSDSLRLSENTVRPRRVELLRAGRIRAAGERTTRAGRMAQAWVACEVAK